MTQQMSDPAVQRGRGVSGKRLAMLSLKFVNSTSIGRYVEPTCI